MGATLPSIDYYYAVMSGFAYLGEPELRRIAGAAGASIRYRPVDIVAVFAAIETVPPARQAPARRRWRDAELKRWAAVRGLPVNTSPKHWPIPIAAASRAVIAAQDMGLAPGALSSALLAAVWVEDRDISDEATVRDITARIFPSQAEDIAARAAATETAATLEANTRAAIETGVIGSPTYVCDGELLFGQDRLPFLAARLGVAT